MRRSTDARRSTPTLERMTIFVRTIALLFALGVTAGPVVLSLVIAGVEPSRPVQVSWVAPFALGGLVAAAGYLVVAIAPRRLSLAVLELRVLVACLLAMPCAVASYLLTVTGSTDMVYLCSAVIAGTAFLLAACVWPAWLARSSPTLPQTALGVH